MSPVSHGHHDSITSDREMHELNQEADLLDQKMAIVPSGANGEHVKLERHNSDPEAEAMVIESLRSQVQDLFSQVSQLNNKLVRSYDRVSDLEDQLHITSDNLRTASLKVSQLEFERAQHLSALSTGLLVEKSHVTSELTRLMEKATEEAARRGQAESAQAEIEKDLDDLSAGLFDQANNMVVQARIAQARSERKLEETEQALRSAEEIVGVLQEQMQTLEEEKERADRRVEEMRMTMGKGKWVDRVHGPPRAPRLLSNHAPYREFIGFVAHLRSIRPSTPQLPAMSTLLSQPFLARLVTEDSDPTVRLDLAPSLNWLSRRTVISAIHAGQLTVEPMATPTLLEELSHNSIPGSNSHTHVTCALCGVSVMNPPAVALTPSSSANSAGRPGLQGSWSSSLFKNSLVQSISTNSSSPFSTPRPSEQQLAHDPPVQVYIFRLDVTSSSGLPSLPLSSQQPGNQTRQSTIYPLCTSNWCLTRLRTTCSLWAFVRTSIVEKVWEEEVYSATHSASKGAINGAQHGLSNGTSDADKGYTPPRLSTRMGISSIWGSVSRSMSGSREFEKEPSKLSEKPLERRLPPKLPAKNLARRLPPPPPVHPSSPRAAEFPKGGTLPPLPARSKDRGRDAEPRRISLEEIRSSEDSINEPSDASEAAGEAIDELPEDQAASADVEDSAEKPHDQLTITPPTVLSRNVSGDSFTTPTEEFHSSLATRSSSPTTVPLPDSPPPDAQAHPSEPNKTTPEDSLDTPTADEATTPVIKKLPIPSADPEVPPVAEEKASTDATPAPPTLPRRMHPVVTEDGKPPSRPGSPAAPPLPRRARPVSTIDNTKPSSRPSSPAVPPRKVPVTVSSETEPAEAAVSSSSPNEATDAPTANESHEASTTDEQPAESDVHPPEAEEATTEQPEHPVVNPQVPPPLPRRHAHTTSEQPSSRSGSPVPPPLPRRSATRRPQSLAVTDAPPSTDPEAEAADVLVEEPTGDDALGDRSPSDVVPQVNGLSDISVSEDEDVPASHSDEEGDSDVYVSDNTWEERTWKELVRLREEMFWARVGGRR